MKVQLAIQIVFFCTIFCKAQAPMLVHDANPDLQPAHCSKVGDEVYFAAWENLSWQPWKSDGTDGGTVRIKDIVGGSAGFDKFVEMNGIAFFYATTPNSGKELWRTDGSPAGTYMIKDINPGSTDGAGGVTPVVFNNRVYFAADNGLQGMELWSTDGTEAGTTFVDVIAGQDGSNPDQLTVLNGVLYFVAEGLSFWSIPNGVIIINDREIFKTDGTAAGTTPVNAPLFDNAYRKPLALTVFQNNLYFTAEAANFQDGRELWKSDGAALGTTRVKNIHPVNGVEAIGQIYGLFPTDNYLFFPADDNVHGRELWRSDGTEAGTVMALDLDPGLPGSINQMIASTSDKVFFSRYQNNEFVIYASDGTAAGTVNLQQKGQLPAHIVVNNKLIFTSHDNTNFWAIWQSDGTLAGTTLLADVDGALDQLNSPSQFASVNGALFFRANDGVHGNELWKMDLVVGVKEQLTLSGPKVFPNPASGSFTLTLARNGLSGSMRVFSASGIEVFNRFFEGNTVEIDCPNWPAGLYFLQIWDSDQNAFFCEKIQIN